MAEVSQSVYFSVRLRFSSAVLCVIYLKGLHRVALSFTQSILEFLVLRETRFPLVVPGDFLVFPQLDYVF